MYYKLSLLIDNKHKYPQVECLTPFTAQLLSPWHKFGEAPKLEFKLQKGAKLSDLLSTTSGPACDLLISPKFFDVLSQFRMLDYQDFESIILLKDEKIIYNWLHFYGPNIIEYINFKDSAFIETEWTFPKCPIEIKSFEHYLSLKEKDSSGAFGVGIDKIVFKEHFNMDLFFIFPFDSTIYMSERMAINIIAENLSGIYLEKTTRIVE